MWDVRNRQRRFVEQFEMLNNLVYRAKQASQQIEARIFLEVLLVVIVEHLFCRLVQTEAHHLGEGYVLRQRFSDEAGP